MQANTGDATVTTDGEPVILWFRNDLRLQDNPALNHAAATGRPILPVYILDLDYDRRPGAASLWWLDKSLRALDASLKARGSRLILRRGESESQLRRLIDETGADALYMNRLFTPHGAERDADIAHALMAEGVECKGYNGALLCRPGGVMTGSGGPYKVFTPFYRALMDAAEPPPHTLGPREIATPKGIDSDAIDDWDLHPSDPDWSKGFDWTPGEDGAQAALATFVGQALKTYSIGRDHPAEVGGSRLSPHLHFGEISPWRAVLAARDSKAPADEIEKFTKELSWRDFSAQLLHHFPFIPQRAFRPEFDNTEWRTDAKGLKAWKAGRTGYPIVDAGMRQLWA
ncbi:MAG: deoxyribodipyrimidine photo-lyase, partial [Brevundimonas sp.]